MFSKQFLEALATDDKDQAGVAFQASLNDKISDALEVRKVEIASSILTGTTEVVEEEVQLDEVSAPGQEDWIKANKKRFIAQYGKEKGLRVLYAKAWKMAKEEVDLTEGGPTRKHFQQTADLIKAVENPEKRKELANHHASVYAQQNPRFNRSKFMAAAGVNESDLSIDYDRHDLVKMMKKAREGMKPFHPTPQATEYMQHVQTHVANLAKKHGKKEADMWKWANEAVEFSEEEVDALNEVMQGGGVTNSQLNRNVLVNLRKATQTLGLKGVNPVQAAAAHRDFGKLVAKNPKAPGYMLMRKLAANKAAQVQTLSQAGVPMGAGLEAHPNEFNQALQRIKRFK